MNVRTQSCEVNMLEVSPLHLSVFAFYLCIARSYSLQAMCLLGGLLTCCHLTFAQQRYEFSHRQMGTSFQIVLYANSDSIAQLGAASAFARIDSLNQILSDYLPDSELNQLAASGGSETAYPISEDLYQVLDAAQEMAHISQGAFDITVGPLVQIWRSARRKHRLPAPETIQIAMNSVGYQHIFLSPEACTAVLKKADMRLDLGGIAKGYAGDEALAVLGEYGIHSALVDGGGDIVLGDPPPGKTGWRISLERITESGERTLQIAELANTAIATSGDTYRYLEVGGKRYSHILDPRNGQALTHQRKVTVIAPTGMLADAWASVLSVISVEEGERVLKDRSWLRARIIEANEATHHQINMGLGD